MTERKIRNAFEHLKEDVMTNVQTEERLEELTGSTADRRRNPHPAWAALAGAAAVAAVVGGSVLLLRPSDPDPMPPATDAVTTTRVEDTPTTTIPSSTIPEALVPVPQGSVIVADPTVAASAVGPESLRVFDGSVVVGGGSGGVVVQRGDALVHILATGETETLVQADDLATDQGPVTLQLHDMARIGGDPAIIFVVSGGDGDSRFSQVWTYEVAGRVAAPIYEVGTSEGEIRRVSVAGGTVVVTRFAEGFSWFDVLDLQGNPTAIAVPRTADSPADIVDSSVDQGVLSADGSTLVYLETSQPAGGQPVTDLVVWDMTTGIEDGRMQLEIGDSITGRLDYDGVAVVVGRQAWNGTEYAPAPIVHIASLDADAGSAAELAATGQPSLTK